tara:strand:+ start:240 stop:440 length:201 start_codon:yes stop_codon:yes gene_type:complete
MSDHDYQMYKAGNRWKVTLATGDTLYHRKASALKKLILSEYRSPIHHPVKFDALYVMAMRYGAERC